MIRLEILLDQIFTRHRWTAHLFFWILIIAVYSVFFGRQNNNYWQTSFFVGLLIPIVISTTYFLNYYLVPRYLLKERYLTFIVYFIYTLIFSVFLEVMTMVLTFVLLAEWQIRNMSPAAIDFFFLITSLLMVVFLGVAIKLLLYWRKSKEDYQKLMREKLEAELKFLKIQLNPHFLFNTLNNLYYLTNEKSDKAPQAIMQLSEMLDYVMQSGKSVFVPLERELKQVENYIALEMLRYENRVQIQFEKKLNLDKWTIAPMMIITLIENAFKHGVMNAAGQSWINISITDNTANLMIAIRNSRKHSAPGNGIGLKNLRNQLDLVYGENYKLSIDDHNLHEFSVTLTLMNQA
ncbi:MAG: histidine kinase [Cyclobacteriaceae bacterium]|nr:histidine kinase [Cyclobacteriaceae bacterium]